MDTLTLAPIKCLLVDDLEENLLALSALLARSDVEILTARSGSEALELLLVHDVALAFLDVQMPDMDGFELAELMRGSERTRHIPLIFVTAGAREQHRACSRATRPARSISSTSPSNRTFSRTRPTSSSSCTGSASCCRAGTARPHRDAAAQRNVQRLARARSAQSA